MLCIVGVCVACDSEPLSLHFWGATKIILYILVPMVVVVSSH